MKTFSPKHCSVVIYNDHKEDDLLPLSLFISIYKSGTVKILCVSIYYNLYKFPFSCHKA